MPNEKPANSEPAEASQAPAQPQQPQAPAYQQPALNQPIGDQADPKSRLAMMCFAFFVAPTGAARAYIGQTIGVVRFWVYVASVVLSFIPIINILAGLSMLVLTVWGFVDFFILHGRRVDAFNQPLYSTSRDDRFVSYLFIIFIILIALAVLVLLIMLILMIAGLSLFTRARGFYY